MTKKIKQFSVPRHIRGAYTIAQAAKLIGKSIRHTRLLCEHGKIDGYKFGKVWIVTDVSKYLKK